MSETLKSKQLYRSFLAEGKCFAVPFSSLQKGASAPPFGETSAMCGAAEQGHWPASWCLGFGQWGNPECQDFLKVFFLGIKRGGSLEHREVCFMNLGRGSFLHIRTTADPTKSPFEASVSFLALTKHEIRRKKYKTRSTTTSS